MGKAIRLINGRARQRARGKVPRLCAVATFRPLRCREPLPYLLPGAIPGTAPRT